MARISTRRNRSARHRFCGCDNAASGVESRSPTAAELDGRMRRGSERSVAQSLIIPGYILVRSRQSRRRQPGFFRMRRPSAGCAAGSAGPADWRYPSCRPASIVKPSDFPGPTSTSISTMVRRPAQSWAMKLASAAQELIASMSGRGEQLFGDLVDQQRARRILGVVGVERGLPGVGRRPAIHQHLRGDRPRHRPAAAPRTRCPARPDRSTSRLTKAASLVIGQQRGALRALPAGGLQREKRLERLPAPRRAFCR